MAVTPVQISTMCLQGDIQVLCTHELLRSCGTRVMTHDTGTVYSGTSNDESKRGHNVDSVANPKSRCWCHARQCD